LKNFHYLPKNFQGLEFSFQDHFCLPFSSPPFSSLSVLISIKNI
jgi:hypothetical protein